MILLRKRPLKSLISNFNRWRPLTKVLPASIIIIRSQDIGRKTSRNQNAPGISGHPTHLSQVLPLPRDGTPRHQELLQASLLIGSEKQPSGLGMNSRPSLSILEIHSVLNPLLLISLCLRALRRPQQVMKNDTESTALSALPTEWPGHAFPSRLVVTE